MFFLLLTLPFVCSQVGVAQTTPANTWHDPSPHHSQTVTVDKDVQLEVLDWGGTGRPLVFLSGLGNTAHIWDNFAPKFTDKHHVYAITRRGFGRSTHASTGYSADRLADDILAVMTQLKIEKPVLVGHSIAGEELSSMGTRHPERISALIYLDAAYTYAFYDAAGDYEATLKDIQQKIDALVKAPEDPKLMDQVKVELPQFEQNLNRKANSMENPLPLPFGPPTAADKASYAAMTKRLAVAVGGVPPEAEPHESFLPRPDGGVGSLNAAPEAGSAVFKGYEHYTAPIQLPILAIMGYPQSKGADFRADTPKNIAAAAAADANQARQIDAFERGQPTAHVIRIAGANHYIFISNETQVFQEMTKFLSTLSGKTSAFRNGNRGLARKPLGDIASK
jgi:pimeloyl-ACP methyl ester carboxylesterase